MANRDAQKLKLEAGVLQGGTLYTFWVNVMPVKNPELTVNASLTFEVMSKGVRAKLAAKRMTFGTETFVRLDGSLSKDLDNRPEKMKV